MKNFCRQISLMRNIDDEIHGNVAIFQYLWEGEEGEVKLAPHGNPKKSNVPFTATKSFVKEKLERDLARHQVRKAIDLTDEDLGCSIFNAQSPAEHVRSTHQGYYTARKLRAKAGTADKHKREWDELYTPMTAAKDEDGDFIRSIVNHPEPMCVLATDNLVPRARVTLVQRNGNEELWDKPFSITGFLFFRFNCAGVSIFEKWSLCSTTR